MLIGSELARSASSEERLGRTALASAGIVVWRWEAWHNHVEWGEGFERLFGRPAREVTYEVWKSLLHPADLAPVTRSMEQAIASSRPCEGEFRIFLPDGSLRWLMYRGEVVPGTDRSAVTLFGVVMDITTRKLAQEDARRSQERLQAALTASGTGTFHWDIRTDCLTWDEELDRLFGLPPGQTPRSLDQFLECVHPDDRAGVIERCERCRRNGADFDMEYRVIKPDGSVHWLYDRGKTYRDEHGRPAYMAGACVDITVRKQAEDALRSSESDLQGLIDGVLALLAYVDRNLIFRRANRRYFEWFGLTQEQVVGHHISEVLGEAYMQRTEGIRDRVLGGETVSIETEIETLGGIRQIHASLIPQHDSDGNVCGFSVLTTDITERKQAEQAIRRQEKLAVVGRLASSISHEINNPLEAVTNLLYLANLEASSPVTRGYIQQAQEQLARVTHVTTHALRFHRQTTRETPVRVDQVLDSVLALYRGRLHDAQIAVHRHYEEADPLIASENELRQVFANLIGNAVDAMAGEPDRRLILRVRQSLASAAEDRSLHVTIADTGTGMGIDTQRRIFEPFFSTKGINGTGLGLWISRELVSKHRGTMQVSSKPGAGSVFRISFDRAGSPSTV